MASKDKAINKMISINDKAVVCFQNRKIDEGLKLIDEAYEMSRKIEVYGLGHWIVEYNYICNHFKFDEKKDLIYYLEFMTGLRDIAKGNENNPEIFNDMKFHYSQLLIFMYQIMMDINMDLGMLDTIEEELKAFSSDVFFSSEELYYIKTGYWGMKGLRNFNVANYSEAIRCFSSILDGIEEDTYINFQQFYYLDLLIKSYQYAGQNDRAMDLSRFVYIKLLRKEIEFLYPEQVNNFVQTYSNGLLILQHPKYVIHICRNLFERGIIDENSADTLCSLYSIYLEAAERCKCDLPMDVYVKAKGSVEKERKEKYKNKACSLADELTYWSMEYLIDKKLGNEYICHLDNMYKKILEKGFYKSDFAKVYLPCARLLLEKYSKLNMKMKVKNVARHMMVQLYNNLRYSLYYIDNDRTLNSLSGIIGGFEFACSATREFVSNENQFEYILNFKNLLPTIIKKRDEAISGMEGMQCISKRVNKVKDEIAVRTSSGKAQEKYLEELFELYRELADLEMEFSSQFKINNRLKHYTLKELHSIFPKDSILINTFFLKKNFYMEEMPESNKVYPYDVMDVYVFCRDGILHREIVGEEFEILINEFLAFEKIVQDSHKKYKKKALKLYGMLFGEILNEFDNINNIYICPHIGDANVAYELILKGNDTFEQSNIIYLQTGREFFEKAPEYQGDSACIIGNPSYSMKEEYSDEITDGKRGEHLVPLIFSEYEAKNIARIYGDNCYVRKEAIKRRIEPGYRILHIATHGFSISEGVEAAWYTSSLSFAGIIDWLDNMESNSIFGNGILTAEEISRMNLKDTELVVLSACNSGNVVVSELNQTTGLHVAFYVAGVKYIIASLWKIDDFATAIFMQLLSKKIKCGTDVTKAITETKREFSIMTVGQIIDMLYDSCETDVLPKELFENLQSMDKEKCIFEHPYYWAGFTCYKNAF